MNRRRTQVASITTTGLISGFLICVGSLVLFWFRYTEPPPHDPTFGLYVAMMGPTLLAEGVLSLDMCLFMLGLVSSWPVVSVVIVIYLRSLCTGHRFVRIVTAVNATLALIVVVTMGAIALFGLCGVEILAGAWVAGCGGLIAALSALVRTKIYALEEETRVDEI